MRAVAVPGFGSNSSAEDQNQNSGLASLVNNQPPSDYVTNNANPAVAAPVDQSGIASLSPQIALDLMWRSMTSGAPTSEFDKYGGYNAVRSAFESAGGQYDRSTIPADKLAQYAQQVSNTGVGDQSLKYSDMEVALPNNLGSGYSGPSFFGEMTPERQMNAINMWFAQNPNPTPEYLTAAVNTIGGLTPELAQIIAAKFGTSSNEIQAGYDKIMEAKAYQNDLAAQAEALKSNINSVYNDQQIYLQEAQKVQDYLNNYNFKPEDISKATGIPLEQILLLLAAKDSTEDEFKAKAKDYHLQSQADPMKAGIANLLADNKITLEEANEIQAYQDNYGFNAADISRVTGQPLDVVNQIIGARGNLIGQGYAANTGNLLGLADYAFTNKLSAKDLSTASGGALTEADAQNLITKAGTTAGRLELASPEAYTQVKGIISRAVNKDYGGKEYDWMYQMFTGLNPTDALATPKQLDFTERKTDRVTGIDEYGNAVDYERELSPATVKNAGVEPIYTDLGDANYQITGYRKKVDSDEFGDGRGALYANYDANGKLTGYEADKRIHTSDPTYYAASWDATGKATPTFINKGRGGFGGFLDDTIGGFKDLVGPELWTLAKIFPATAPYVAGADAVLAASHGDMKGAALNAASAYASYQGNVAADTANPSSAGYTNAADAASDLATTGSTVANTAATNAANTRLGLAVVGAADAAENGNYTPLLNVAAGVSGLNNNPTVATAFNTMGAVNAAANNDMTGLFNSAGNLTGSKDLKLAAAANNFREAYNSGNSTAIITAAAGLSSAAESNARTSGAVQTVKDFVNGSIQTAKAPSVDIIQNLNNSGAVETNPDLNTVLGSSVGKTGTTITPSGGTTTDATDTEFGNLQGAIDTAARAGTVSVSKGDASNANEALRIAQEENPNATRFFYDGKTYQISATNEAVAAAGAPTPEDIVSDRNRLADDYAESLGKKDRTELTTSEVDTFISKINPADQSSLRNMTLQDLFAGKDSGGTTEDKSRIEITGVGNTGGPANPQYDVAKSDLLKWAGTLEGPQANTIKQTLSTILGAAGEQMADLGTAASNTGFVGQYNALVKAGEYLESIGQKLEIPGVTEARNNVLNAVQNEETLQGKGIALATAIAKNPLFLTEVGKEGLQEIGPLLAGGTVFKLAGKLAGLGVDVLTNASESMGTTQRQSYKEEIAKGTPEEDALRISQDKGQTAFLISTATASLADASLIKGYEKAVEKLSTRAVAAGAKELPEEFAEEFLIAVATGDNLNTALTKGVVGAAVGAKTSASVNVASSASEQVNQTFAEQGLTSTDGSFRPETIVSLNSPEGKIGAVASQIPTTIAVAVESGQDVSAAVDSAISTAIDAGVTPDIAISTSVSSAINSGVDAQTAITAAVNAAVNAGVNVNTATNVATNASVNVNTNTNTSTNTDTNTNVDSGNLGGAGSSTATTASPVETKTPTTTATSAIKSTGLNFGQVQQALAAAGIPQLANVFYYGKDFGGKKQKLDKRGELIDEEYDPLSVTKAGAAGELEEQIAEEAKTKENDVNTALDHILGKSSESTSLDDLLNIVKGA